MLTPGSDSGSNHLTNDQFTGMLMTGVTDEACEKHLATCELCREELTAFSDSVGLFGATSLAWSKSKPAESLRVTARRQVRRAAYAPLGWALATAVAIGVAVPVWNYDHRPDHSSPTGQVAAANSQAGDSPAEIAEDNQLLQSVNVALNTNEASPLPEYRLLNTMHASGRPARRQDLRTQ